MTDPEDSTPGAGGRRHGGYDAAREIRHLLDEIDHLHNKLRNQVSDLRSEFREDLRHTLHPIRENLGETSNHVAVMLPRLEDLEARVAALAVRFAADGPTPPGPGPTGHPTDPAAGPSAAAPAGPGDDAPPITPAIGWEDMARDTAERAWQALADFVEHVLYRQYRMTRLQVPDCWPLHPRLVRELAWLRTTYFEAGALEPDEPGAAMPWHSRAIPAFLVNTGEAVDQRECRPGVHRLTEAEVSRFVVAGQTARRDGGPGPLLTTETGYDRPHIVPEHYPTRITKSTVTKRVTDEGNKAPTVEDLPDLVAGPCHPQFWRDHYAAAKAADLADRP